MCWKGDKLELLTLVSHSHHKDLRTNHILKAWEKIKCEQHEAAPAALRIKNCVKTSLRYAVKNVVVNTLKRKEMKR